MQFLNSTFCLLFFIFLIITLILTPREVSSMSTQNWTRRNSDSIVNKKPSQDTFKSRAINSRPFGEEEYENSPFVQSHWTIWDRPEDQLAVEEGGATPMLPQIDMQRDVRRKRKQYNNGTDQSPQQKYSGQFPITASGDNGGTPRQGCNSNLQVSLYPVILVLVAAIAGLITIVILWLIARKWTDLGTTSAGGNSSGGWSRQGHLIPSNVAGFSRVLRNLDFDQLTTLVMNGVETYRKYVEKS